MYEATATSTIWGGINTPNMPILGASGTSWKSRPGI